MLLTGGQAVIESLRAQGVDTVFGIISTHMMPIYDALYDHQEAIRFVSARHEHAAAFMADGYARATGKPGVVFTSTGPGAANSVGAMGEAYFASSPVLNVTSTAEEGIYKQGLGAIHEIKDQLGMFSAVTQWNYHVSRTEEIPDRIHEAFGRFQTRRPRPIELEIPIDLQSNVAEMEIPRTPSITLPTGDPVLIERVARLILSSKRVAVWAGNGVHRAGATNELAQLAEELGVPVFTTVCGRGAIPDDHPLSLGVLGGVHGDKGKLAKDPKTLFMESLDTLLVVGSSLVCAHTNARNLDLPLNLIQVDIDHESIGKLYEPEMGVIGDAKQILGQLLHAMQGKPMELVVGFDQEIKEIKKSVTRHMWQIMPTAMRVMESIRTVVARDAIFMGDVNVAVHQGATYCLPIYEPRTYFVPAWDGLGFAFPAAVGAKAGFPNREVICLTGDGGFQFNLQELGTCIEYGLNPVVLVFNDNAWGVLKGYQKDHYNGRFIGSSLRNPDFVRLAEAYGANGITVTSVKEMVAALEFGIKSETVTVIDVKTPGGFQNFT